jgi:fatty-acyl-CoA synthase
MAEPGLTQSYYPAQGGPLPPPVTIGAMLRKSAARWPHVPALCEVDAGGAFTRSWTYAELLHDAERLGRALASRHAPGARIAVYANNAPEWVLLEMGAALAGLVLVTVNPASIERELRYIVEQSGAEAIYCVESFRGNPLAQIARAVSADVPAVRHCMLLSDHASLFEGEETGTPRAPRPDDAAQIQYTSGTTGQPKGALLHHGGLVRNAADLLQDGGVGPGAVFVLCTPLFHTTGCAVQVLGALAVGATMLLPPAFDPALTARLIAREKLSFALFIPTMMIAVMEAAARDGHDLRSIEHILAGGAMVAPELWRKAWDAFGARVQIAYGQTECSPIITRCTADDSLEDMTQTVGRAAPHTEVSIRDLRTNAVVPIGVQGEICCRGYQLMLGYNDNRQATAATIDAEGWLHTGDLGTMDARGYVRITGRVKEMIIRGGENLFPVEIENAMLEHDAVAEVAVVGIPDETWGETVACFLRCNGAGVRPGDADLKAFVRERLSPQKTPQHWVWIEQWPLTGSGKIQKFRLREQFVAGEFARIPAE